MNKQGGTVSNALILAFETVPASISYVFFIPAISSNVTSG